MRENKESIFQDIREFFQAIINYEDIGSTLWFVIPGVIGIMIGFSTMRYAENSNTWPVAEGKVISCDLRIDASTGIRTPGGGHSSGHTSYKPVIKYEYFIRGNRYESTNLSFGYTGFSDKRKAISILRKYTPGQYINVYYKPDNPAIAVLNKGPREVPIPFIVGVGFTALSLPLFIFAVFNKVKRLLFGNNL
jgi:hypothetical protein